MIQIYKYMCKSYLLGLFVFFVLYFWENLLFISYVLFCYINWTTFFSTNIYYASTIIRNNWEQKPGLSLKKSFKKKLKWHKFFLSFSWQGYTFQISFAYHPFSSISLFQDSIFSFFRILALFNHVFCLI